MCFEFALDLLRSKVKLILNIKKFNSKYMLLVLLYNQKYNKNF